LAEIVAASSAAIPADQLVQEFLLNSPAADGWMEHDPSAAFFYFQTTVHIFVEPKRAWVYKRHNTKPHWLEGSIEAFAS
jgi:hypothetical protein